ncbi:MAG: UxaA family hydrolase [Dehalococcoidia bacterium]|nr:UxaA family hydrolase [Dehalococcoidia bacterium]
MNFYGYLRPDGSVGARNHVAVIPAVRCANELAIRIADEAGMGVVALLHNQPCIHLKPDNEMALRVLIGLGTNPNVAAAVVVGIGCDGLPAQDIAEGIAKSNKPLELITIEREGSYQAALDKGVRVAKEMLSDASLLTRQPFDLSHLVLGTKCTASTPASALACNPTVGWAADAIIAQGGSAVFSETAEIVGAEHILAKRAADERTAQRIYEVANRMEKRMKDSGVDIRGSEPTPGNIQGGLTTLEEKSLGAIAKSGTSPIRGVLEWGEKLQGKGLFFMDGSANTPQIFLGLAAAGAQLMSLNFGGGLPARFRTSTAASCGGLPILPVIKVLSSPKDSCEMEYFDVYAGTIIQGQESVPEVGERLLKEITAVASGKPTKLEMFSRYQEVMEMYTTGPVL